MRNIKLIVEYDGGAYAGWQQQKDCPTVQGELRRAIEQVVQHPTEVQGASRTDRGVHARGQTANIRTDRSIPTRNLQLAINTYLPADIALARVEEVDESFDARLSAVGKHYRYTVFLSDIRSAFHARWSCRRVEKLNVADMRVAAEYLRGEKDFAGFRNRSKQEPPTTLRTVHAVEIVEHAPFLVFEVVGKSFLYNMVRVMVGTLLEVGGGKRSPQSILEVFETADRNAAGPTAEPQGLCLLEVCYDESRLRQVTDNVHEGRALKQDLAVPHCGPLSSKRVD